MIPILYDLTLIFALSLEDWGYINKACLHRLLSVSSREKWYEEDEKDRDIFLPHLPYLPQLLDTPVAIIRQSLLN